MPSPIQTADAIARLEQCRRMITLDEAVEILTGRKRPFARQGREAARNFWLDISQAATAPFRKVEDVIEGEVRIPLSELELYLHRCRKVGYIEQLGMEVPYFEIEGEGLPMSISIACFALAVEHRRLGLLKILSLRAVLGARFSFDLIVRAIATVSFKPWQQRSPLPVSR